MRKERAEQRLGRSKSHCESGWQAPRPQGAWPAPLVAWEALARATFGGCEPASPFFAKRIQNEFCGIGKSTQEPAGPCAPLNGGRWVCEREGAGSPCGGDVEAQPWHLSAAAFTGRCWSQFIHRRSRAVPYGLPGYRRLRRAPPQHRGLARLFRARRGIWEDSFRRKGIPRVRRGVGYVGAWRFARPF
jgi:hypothetical protein